jgi:hypothetical protein
MTLGLMAQPNPEGPHSSFGQYRPHTVNEREAAGNRGTLREVNRHVSRVRGPRAKSRTWFVPPSQGRDTGSNPVGTTGAHDRWLRRSPCSRVQSRSRRASSRDTESSGARPGSGAAPEGTRRSIASAHRTPGWLPLMRYSVDEHVSTEPIRAPSAVAQPPEAVRRRRGTGPPARRRGARASAAGPLHGRRLHGTAAETLTPRCREALFRSRVENGSRRGVVAIRGRVRMTRRTPPGLTRCRPDGLRCNHYTGR